MSWSTSAIGPLRRPPGDHLARSGGLAGTSLRHHTVAAVPRPRRTRTTHPSSTRRASAPFAACRPSPARSATWRSDAENSRVLADVAIRVSAASTLRELPPARPGHAATSPAASMAARRQATSSPTWTRAGLAATKRRAAAHDRSNQAAPPWWPRPAISSRTLSPATLPGSHSAAHAHPGDLLALTMPTSTAITSSERVS